MAVVTGHTCNVTGFYGSKPKEERQGDCPACQRQSLYAKGRVTDKPKAPLMPEPTNEELRQACEAESALCTRPDDCGVWSHLIARALLSRLDREAEAERLLKVAREAIEKAPHIFDCKAALLQRLGGKCDCWKSRVLAEIAPAAPEGPKP